MTDGVAATTNHNPNVNDLPRNLCTVRPTVSEFMTSFTAVAGHRSHLNEGVSDGYAAADRDRGAGRAGRSKSEVARRYGVSRRWVISVVQRYLADGDAGCARGRGGR